MSEKAIKRIHVIFKGRVQGVGFRYTAVSIAEGLNCMGWVRNLDNGDVEIVAEQTREVLENFVDRLGHEFSGYIENRVVDWESATGAFKDFSVL